MFSWQFSKTPDSWQNLSSFQNPRVFKTHGNSNQWSFSVLPIRFLESRLISFGQTRQFLSSIFQTPPISRTNLRFSLMFEKSAFQCTFNKMNEKQSEKLGKFNNLSNVCLYYLMWNPSSIYRLFYNASRKALF